MIQCKITGSEIRVLKMTTELNLHVFLEMVKDDSSQNGFQGCWFGLHLCVYHLY